MRSKQLSRARIVSYWVLLVLSSLVALELGLRIAGWFFLWAQHRQNGGQGVTIVTLGESTTADAAARNGRSWPRILGTLLQKDGQTVRIVNEARVGTTTLALIRLLPEIFEEQHPAIIIAMMGVNDRADFWLKRAGLVTDGWFASLRVVKLLRFVATLISPPRPEIPVYPSNLGYPATKELLGTIRARGADAARAEIDRFLADKTPLDKSRFLAWIGKQLMPPWGAPDAEFRLAFDFRERAVQYSLEVGEEAEIVALLATTLHPASCESLAERFVQTGSAPSEIALQRLGTCIGRETPALRTLARRYGSEYDFRFGSKETPTAESYRTLWAELRSRGKCLVVMQYPLLSIEPLREYFRGTAEPAEPRLRFVSNDANFREALTKHRFEEIFYDRFAGTFGHSTELGNTLIASGLEPTVLELIRSGLCAQ